MRRPILPGTSDLDQLEKIWQLCGSPNQHNWPNHDQLPGCEGVIRFNSTHSRRVKAAYERWVVALTCAFFCQKKEFLMLCAKCGH
jgi:serine/threonine-protein kinase BUR1